MKIYSAYILPENPQHYYATSLWAEVAIAHNSKALNQELCVVSSDNPGYQEMCIAARGLVGNDWLFGTLTNYVALREFAESPGPSDELFIWLEADMVVNPLLDDPAWLEYRGVFAIWQKEHLMTVHEHYKRDYAVEHLGVDKAEWTQILSTMVMLDRGEISTLLNSLHGGGYDLYTRSAWERISQKSPKYPDHSFYSDQVLELGYLLSGTKPQTIKDLVGWVSYDSGYAAKPIVHFDSVNKPRLPAWLDKMNNSSW